MSRINRVASFASIGLNANRGNVGRYRGAPSFAQIQLVNISRNKLMMTALMPRQMHEVNMHDAQHQTNSTRQEAACPGPGHNAQTNGN
mgnify:CR=1 FL=1